MSIVYRDHYPLASLSLVLGIDSAPYSCTSLVVHRAIVAHTRTYMNSAMVPNIADIRINAAIEITLSSIRLCCLIVILIPFHCGYH